MLFTPEIVSAFETIINAAENDFEMHRIKVLLRDLTAPPTVEQIDETHQKFNGVVYRKNSDRHYRIQTTIYQAVYFYHTGQIADFGEVIHHKDFNPENNNIENLQLLTRAEHRQVHNLQAPKTKTHCVICGEEIESYNGAKYCSRQCRDIAESKTKICPNCGKSFQSNDRIVKYCSNHCAQSMRQKRRKLKRENATFICQFCGRTYKGSESKSDKFCSKSCISKAFYRTKKITRNCVVCGKEFVVSKWSKTVTCSGSCANTLRWNNRREKESSSE